MNSAIEAWREQVMAFDRDMEEIRGGDQEHGRSRPVFASEPLDPYRTGDPALNALYEIVGNDAEVLDVGGGAGRFALSLATRAKRVTVVDPSPESLGPAEEPHGGIRHHQRDCRPRAVGGRGSSPGGRNLLLAGAASCA